MEKLISEWLETLNGIYREQALNNFRNQVTIDKPCSSLAAAITSGFAWRHTPQGYGYWDKFFKLCQESEEINVWNVWDNANSPDLIMGVDPITIPEEKPVEKPAEVITDLEVLYINEELKLMLNIDDVRFKPEKEILSLHAKVGNIPGVKSLIIFELIYSVKSDYKTYAEWNYYEENNQGMV